MHYMPRLLRIDGSVIRHQLAGNRMLDHELVSAVVRRQSQLDKESMSESLYMSYPHLFEPDFLADCRPCGRGNHQPNEHSKPVCWRVNSIST